MKNIIFLLFCLPVFLLIPVQMTAQTCSTLDFDISKTTVTDATCLSNGEIDVEISNQTANVSYLEYSLSSTSGTFTITYQPGNILKNIPPGTYSVSVRAFCKDDEGYFVVKSAYNVKVGGSYKVTQASFSPGNSRKSYTNCGTGHITLEVVDGGGSFTFNILQTPDGLRKGPVTPIQNGTFYTLPGEDWPAGVYQISVDDGCYTAMANFTLDAITGFPSFTYESYAGYRSDINNLKNSCNFIGWYAFSNNLVKANANYNADYDTYFSDGMYEIGIAPYGTTVDHVTNWLPWTENNESIGSSIAGYMYFDLSPHTIKDFYSPSYNLSSGRTLTVFLRVKGCPSTYKSFDNAIKPPVTTAVFQTVFVTCNAITVRPWYDYDAEFCYPLTLTIETDGGTELYRKEGWVYNTDNATAIPFTYDAGPYTITFTDADGTSVSYPANPSFNNNFNAAPFCGNYYSPYFRVNSVSGAMNGNCYPYAAIVTVTDDEGHVIGTATVYNNNYTMLSAIHMDYGKNYTVRVDYPNGSSETFPKNVPAAPTPSLSVQTNINCYCDVNYGYFSLSIPSGMNWPTGSRFTITGPDGYVSQEFIASSPTNNTYNFLVTALPPGEYTLTYDWGGGGCPQTVPFTCLGTYNYRDLGYDSEMTCSGLKITPKGSITYRGVNSTTYFRFIDGPDGYDKTVKSSGGSFLLSASGTYTLGVLVVNSSVGCALGTQTIEYTASPLSLDADFTSAYVCVDETTGYISIRAINGTPPFTYQLYNEANTSPEDDVPDVISDNSATFNYGGINETYTVRVRDNCENTFNQKVTLRDLHTARIVYSPDKIECLGGTIELDCVTLGTTKYHWTGPDGFESDEQNPVIPDARPEMTGWYEVTVQPEFCGKAITDGIYVTVHAMKDISGIINQEVCTMSKPVVMINEITGGSGDYIYQWQSSPDGFSNWEDIPEATESSYQLPVQSEPGVFYFRCVTYDMDCALTYYGDSRMIIIDDCYSIPAVPVNPNLRSLPKR